MHFILVSGCIPGISHSFYLFRAHFVSSHISHISEYCARLKTHKCVCVCAHKIWFVIIMFGLCCCCLPCNEMHLYKSTTIFYFVHIPLETCTNTCTEPCRTAKLSSKYQPQDGMKKSANHAICVCMMCVRGCST